MRTTGASCGAVASACVLLLAAPIWAWTQGTQGAHDFHRLQSLRPDPPDIATPITALESEPKLRSKVWLVAPDSTVERTLTDLMARITPQVHLKLQAQESVQQLHISCFVAGLPLRDLLTGLTAYTRMQWRRTDDNTLTLGVPYLAPAQDVAAHQEEQGRIAYYGMRVVKTVAAQPADLRQLLQRGMVRLASVPVPVQQAIQDFMQTQLRTPIGPIHTPLDPQTTGIQLGETSEGNAAGYRLGISLTQPVDQRPFDLTINLIFTPQQAADYRPDARKAEDPIRKAQTTGSLSQPVTLNLRKATLTEALKALFTTTHAPLLAGGVNPTAHEDFNVTKLPLRDALDRLCGVYGLRWEQLQSGLILFWTDPSKIPADAQ